jgi:fumarate reductase subunit C
MSARRQYVRPMDGWWRRDPRFLRYMAREATAPFVVAYALVLLVGIVRLSQGEAAFEGWLEALRSPGSIAFHGVLVAVFLYHSWSWFRIMPKTLRTLRVAGRRLPGWAITAAGLAASAAASLLMLLLAWTLGS